MAIEEIAATTKGGKQLKEASASIVGVEVLVHDGKNVIARHGHGQTTGTGNLALKVLKGSKAELDAEVAKLGLTYLDSMTAKTYGGTVAKAEAAALGGKE